MALNNNITMTHSGLIGDKETGKHYVLVRFERPDEEIKPKKVIIGETRKTDDSRGEGKGAGEENVTIREKRKTHEIEIKLPSCETIVNNGFSSDEAEELKAYLKEHEKEIMDKARSISSFLHIFG